MKLILIECNDNLKDWGMNRIKQVKRTYDKILKSIQYQKQELLDNIPSSSILSSQLLPSQVVYLNQDTPMASAAILFNKPIA